MSDRAEKLRALYLAALLSLAVFAGATAFGGSVAAATISSGNVSVGNSPSVNLPADSTTTIDPSSDSKVPVAINLSNKGHDPADIRLRSLNYTDPKNPVLLNNESLTSAGTGLSGDGNVTITANSVGSDFTLKVQAFNTSDSTVLADNTTDMSVSDSPPSISNVNLVEGPFQNLQLTFTSDEQLGFADGALSVSVDGPSTNDVYTFDRSDFATTDSSAPYTYQLAVTQLYDDGPGTYTATIDTAEDPNGNDGASSQNDDYDYTTDFTSKSIDNRDGGPDLDTNNVSMLTQKFGGQFAVVRLENTSKSLDRRDISGEISGSNVEDTELWVNFTVDNFNPDVLIGTANVDSWDYTMNGDGSANVNVSLKPASTERNFTAWNDGINNPSNWGDKYEGSDLSMDAVVDFGLGNISGGGGGPQGLDGARLTTDAQAYTVPKLDANDNLTVDVASPHCVADTAGSPTNDCSGEDVNDGGFYEAVIPSTFYQQQWDVDELSAGDVDVTYSTGGSTSSDTEWDISVREDGSLVINGSNIHYSEGTVNIVETADSGDSGGSDDSSSSSGGGGGGTVATTVTTRSIDGGTTATIERVTADDPTASIAVEGAETGVLSVREASVTFGKTTNAENTMTVTASDTQPSNTPSLPVEDRILGYVTVDVSGPLAGDMTEGTFTLDLDGSGVDPDDVTAHRYDGSEWEPVTVQQHGDGSVTVISKNGFSPFAIGTSEASDTETPTETSDSDTSGTPTGGDTPTPTPLPDVDTTDTQETTEAETPESDATGTDTPTPGADGPGFGLAIAALALALTVALARRL